MNGRAGVRARGGGRRLSRLAGAVMAIGLTLAGQAALAQAEREGLPQFNTDYYASLIFWLLVTFGLLYWLMASRIVPRISEVLEERQDRISADLDQAERLRNRADEIWRNYENSLAEARQEAQQELDRARQEIDAKQDQRQREVSERLRHQAQEAEARIAREREAALDSLREVATEVVQASVSRIAGISLDQGQAGQAVDRVMSAEPGSGGDNV